MSAKHRAKRAREEVEEWDGLDNDDPSTEQAKGSDSDSDSDDENPVDTLLTTLGPRLEARSKGQLSTRATLFFDRPDFNGIEDEDEERNDASAVAEAPKEPSETINGLDEIQPDSESEDDGFEEVPVEKAGTKEWEDDSDDEKLPNDKKPGRI